MGTSRLEHVRYRQQIPVLRHAQSEPTLLIPTVSRIEDR